MAPPAGIPRSRATFCRAVRLLQEPRSPAMVPAMADVGVLRGERKNFLSCNSLPERETPSAMLGGCGGDVAGPGMAGAAQARCLG